MKAILKYIILGLFMLNLPGIANVQIGIGVSSIMSYASFLLMAGYYVLFLKGKPNIWLMYIGLSYFLIAGLNSYVDLPLNNYIVIVSKYLILVVFGNSFFRSVTKREMVIFLLIGATTVILNATIFPDKYGRYSGFYLNPNAAGFLCIIGYSLCFTIKHEKFKLLCQIVFTIAGLLTFSRTFILVWILINLISLRINIKNIRVLGIGLLLGVLLLTFGELFNLNGLRFKQYQSVLSSKSSVSSLEEGGRSETWALFYDEIYTHPFFGGGYGKFQGGGIFRLGPHNTYLLIIGEAGIIPLVLFVMLMLYLLFWSNKLFKLDPTLFLLSFALSIYLLASHTYFIEYIKLCLTLFIFNQIDILKKLGVNSDELGVTNDNKKRTLQL